MYFAGNSSISPLTLELSSSARRRYEHGLFSCQVSMIQVSIGLHRISLNTASLAGPFFPMLCCLKTLMAVASAAKVSVQFNSTKITRTGACAFIFFLKREYAKGGCHFHAEVWAGSDMSHPRQS